jgi:hypothetical protein
VSCSQELEEPTEEQVSQTCHEESAQISAALVSIPWTHSSSTLNVRPNTSMGLLDLSRLVELRATNETLQARNGVRNLNREVATAGSAEGLLEVDNQSDFKHAQQQIIKQFYQLLQDADAEGERVGTGLH